MLRPLLFWWHVVIVVGRQALGRWYVLRDRPLWFVEQIADIGVYHPKHNKESQALVADAVKELELRKRRGEA